MIEQELRMLLQLLVACILGGLIGFERAQTGKVAGLRTHMLIALGAAMFVSFTALFVEKSAPLAPVGPAGNFRLQIDPLGTVQAVVTGISFLGAGMIFVSRRSNQVKNLTTAATIWVTAAIGIAVGVEAYVLASGATLLVLFILRVLPSSNELADEATEATPPPASSAHAGGEARARSAGSAE